MEVFDDALSRFTDDMVETMYYENGIGLAATQVGRDMRLMVVDISEHKNEPRCFINPRITRSEGVETMTEGCLSVPGFTADVQRAAEITVEAVDRNGEPFTLDAGALLAVCIQHEIDHLNGKLFIDHLSPVRRQRFMEALRKNKTAPKRRTEGRRLEYLARWDGDTRRKEGASHSAHSAP